jgi:hypothetical protein
MDDPARMLENVGSGGIARRGDVAEARGARGRRCAGAGLAGAGVVILAVVVILASIAEEAGVRAGVVADIMVIDVAV